MPHPIADLFPEFRIVEASEFMNGDGDVCLFIGILPGADHRQLVLFPEGQILADLRGSEIETGGYSGPDRGMIAASMLIGLLRRSGWYVEEMPHAGAVWMRPNAGDSSDGIAEDDGELAGDSPVRP